ncbi:MAG TPA: LptA/OstA family protein [Stellaceae bacterium]|jgi:lipopolysaccharide export system protein LptA
MKRGAAGLLAVFVMVAAAATHAQAPAKSPAPKPPATATAPAAANAQTPGNTPSSAMGLAGDDNNKPVNIEADNGIEWQQNNKVYIARGNAKATRGDNSVTADTLYAYYRDVQQPAAAANGSATAAPTPPKPAAASTQAGQNQSPLDNGSTQIYRIEADGHVVFASPTQTAYGDHAIYDVDQALLVLTGKNLKIITPQDIVTSRDSLEWYDQKQIGVARGNAVAVRQGPEAKSIRGDILTADVTKPPDGPSKITKVNAQGHVIVVSADQIARGDTGVYNLDTGIATLSKNVTLTRGGNELRGQYAVVDTNTNVARLLSAPPSAKLTGPPPRVAGLLIPRQEDEAALSGKPAAAQPSANGQSAAKPSPSNPPPSSPRP